MSAPTPRPLPPRSLRRAAALALAALVALGGIAVAGEPAGEAERLAEVLALQPGMTVADVGAGDGEWTVGLAEAVGPSGRVWATEVKDDELAAIRRRVDDAGLGNVEVVRGDQRRTGLPAGCCDAILLRMVYHHFEDPAAMRADLARALRPGGRLVVIDIVPQTGWRRLEGVPDRGGHGIPPERLVEEMAGHGFEPVARLDGWNDDAERFCVVFVRGAQED